MVTICVIDAPSRTTLADSRRSNAACRA